MVARTADSLDAVAKDIKTINPNIKVLAIPTDLTSSDSVTKMWEKVKSEFGHADVLVNNAGTFTDTAPIKDADAGKWWYDFVSLTYIPTLNTTLTPIQEVNVHGTFFVTQGFLKLIGDKKGTVINLTTGAAHSVFPNLSAYSLSKLVALQLVSFITAENPNVNAIALHPGMVPTDMMIETFRKFAHDTPELVGGVGVWLATEDAAFLTGRYVAANWSVEELLEGKEEILKENKLTMALVGKFGVEQFA